MSNSALLRVEDLKVHFPFNRGMLWWRQTGYVYAVDGVSFAIQRGETLGLVGESGCGKSTTGRAILQLVRPTAGHVFFRDQDLTMLEGNALRRMRRQMQIVFQDPYASLDPRMSVGATVGEPLIVHRLASGREVQERVQDLLSLVGLNPRFMARYPHEFSGGQRQRIGVARALAVQPELIICDEPISSLDVSIQAQIINLLEDLQAQFGLTYLFIAHDLSVVRHISTRVAVMYLGRIVELAERRDLYHNAIHPYTQALLSAVPIPDPKVERRRRRVLLEGDVPSAMNPPAGCCFCTRCPLANDRCRADPPAFRQIASNHWVSCHRFE